MTIDLWKFFAGLGAFLFGMSQLEDALKQLAGRTFKLFLKRHTKNKAKAILSGALVTGVLQSSSVVTMIVLGFVGAGILNMRSAFAVVLGSNLGTTFDSWIVATLGFKFDAEKLAFPLIAFSGAGFLIFQKRATIQSITRLLMGCGLLLLGLGFMKSGVEALAEGVDLSRYSQLNNLSFVLIGFLVTAIIQSSFATMVIVLSALNIGTIPFHSAAAIIIGSELGTSIKTIFGSLGNVPEKKKVAYGNIIFNLFITILAYIFLLPLIRLVREVIGIEDPLIALVLFQSLINLAGILLFFPFLDTFANLMDKLFSRKKSDAVHFILNDRQSETFIDSLEKETRLFIYRVLYLNATAFGIRLPETEVDVEIKKIVEEEAGSFHVYNARYMNIKQAEGEILSAYNKIAGEQVDKEDFIRRNQLISAVRSAMYAAKGVKDLQQDREELKSSSNDMKFATYNELREGLEQFYTQVLENMAGNNNTALPEKLSELMKDLQKNYEAYMERIHQKSGIEKIREMDVSTLLNANRELYSSGKSMLHALKNYLLSPEEAERFDNAFGPGF